MRKLNYVTGAALVISASAAFAADIQRPAYYAPAPAAPIGAYNWVGPYAGINLGYQWGSVSNVPGGNIDPAGIMGGAQFGYNWQSGQFVFGAETDLQLSGSEDTFAPFKFSNPWFGTLRGRVGYAFNNILVYGTAGLAYGSLHVEGLGFTESNAGFGWTAGLGLELGLTQNWSVRAEYLYVGLGDHFYGLTGRSHDIDSSVFRMGVNYRF